MFDVFNTQIETTDKKVHSFIDVDGGGSEDVWINTF